MYLVSNFIRLQAVQKFACRITSGTRKYDHLTPFLKKTEMVTCCKRAFLSQRMAFKCISGCVPEYLFSPFIKRTEVSNRRARNSQRLNIPLFKTSGGRRTFYYRTLSLRNSLDPSLKLCTNVKLFKQSIRSKLLQELYELSLIHI